MNKLWHWAPRVLGIIFALFISLFALDADSGSIVIHLVPSLIILAAVLVSWKRAWLGAVLFFGFAIAYIILIGLSRPWSWYASVSAPPALVGILYLLSWLSSKRYSSASRHL